MSKNSEVFAGAVKSEMSTVKGGGGYLLLGRLAKLWNLIDIGDLIPDDLTEDQVIAAVRKVWDEMIVPIDIPYVPEFAEKILEGWFWKVIETKIREWFPEDTEVIGEEG